MDRQDGLLTIHCAKCGATVSGNTLSECRADWRLRHGPGRRAETGNLKRAAGKPPWHPR